MKTCGKALGPSCFESFELQTCEYLWAKSSGEPRLAKEFFGGSESDLKWQSVLNTHVSGIWSCPDNRSKIGILFRGLTYLAIDALRRIYSGRKIYNLNIY